MKKVAQRGFTLVEVLIVVSLIGVVTGVAIQTLKPSDIHSRGRDTKRQADIETVRAALERYVLDQTDRRYPSGPYINLSTVLNRYLEMSLPTDPETGASYEYQTNGDRSCFWLKASLERESCYAVVGGNDVACPPQCVFPSPTPTPVPCWGLNGRCDSGCNVVSVSTPTVYTGCGSAGSCCTAYDWRRSDGSVPVGERWAYQYPGTGYSNPNCTGTAYSYMQNPGYNCSTDRGCLEFIGSHTLCSARSWGRCYNCGRPCRVDCNVRGYDSMQRLYWTCISGGTYYRANGPTTKYTGSGSCSRDGSGRCYKLTTPGGYYTSDSCGGFCGSGTYYSGYGECQWYR